MKVMDSGHGSHCAGCKCIVALHTTPHCCDTRTHTRTHTHTHTQVDNATDFVRQVRLMELVTHVAVLCRNSMRRSAYRGDSRRWGHALTNGACDAMPQVASSATDPLTASLRTGDVIDLSVTATVGHAAPFRACSKPAASHLCRCVRGHPSSMLLS